MAELLSTRAADAVEKLVKDSRRGTGGTPRTPPPPVNGYRPPLIGILLSDLTSGGSTDAAVLAEFSAGQTQNQIQKVVQLGSVTSGTFTLGWAPQGQSVQTTPALKWNISAADMQTALNKLTTIGPNGVTVTLGKQTYTNNNTHNQTTENPGIWLVSFTGKQFADITTFPLLTVTPTLSGELGPATSISDLTYWGDTGRVETVKAAIPVGTPTPLRAGATFMAHLIPGSGYVLGSVEPRAFGLPY